MYDWKNNYEETFNMFSSFCDDVGISILSLNNERVNELTYILNYKDENSFNEWFKIHKNNGTLYAK